MFPRNPPRFQHDESIQRWWVALHIDLLRRSVLLADRGAIVRRAELLARGIGVIQEPSPKELELAAIALIEAACSLADGALAARALGWYTQRSLAVPPAVRDALGAAVSPLRATARRHGSSTTTI